MTTKTKTALPALEEVFHAYAGRAGKCCCGCSGTHSYTENHATEANAYGCKVSNRSVKLIYNRMRAAVAAGTELVCSGPTCWSLDLGTRTLCLYTR